MNSTLLMLSNGFKTSIKMISVKFKGNAENFLQKKKIIWVVIIINYESENVIENNVIIMSFQNILF